MDETSLIRAAQKGDRDAFERLIEAYDRDVLRLALNLLRDCEDARDVYQEAFVRVFTRLHTFRFDCSFYTWLYRIVVNLCLDVLRGRKMRLERFTGDNNASSGQAVDELPEQRPWLDPERTFLNHEVGKRIEEILNGLTPKERMVFVLRHYHGMRLKCIGEILGFSEEAAKNCLFRATRKMRAALGDFL